ncbi:hypothetical protein H0E87_014453, partial [Populus deltoides]
VLSFLKIAGSACSVCYAGLPLGADALSGVGPLGNDWRMLSFCFIQLGFAKLVEPGCWTFCLLRCFMQFWSTSVDVVSWPSLLVIRGLLLVTTSLACWDSPPPDPA